MRVSVNESECDESGRMREQVMGQRANFWDLILDNKVILNLESKGSVYCVFTRYTL